MGIRLFAAAAAMAGAVLAQPQAGLGEAARQYLLDLIRLDTTDPPGNETRVAQYLQRIASIYGLDGEMLGPDPARLNFLVRLKGTGEKRPLLLIAHSDVVPVDPLQWSVPAFAAEVRDAEIYGRGAQDAKNLLAAEVAVLTQLKRLGTPLKRDVILLAEADEEAGSSGIRWMIANAWDKIEADAAFNEGGVVRELPSGVRVFQVQTAEKIPTRVKLRARGTAGHASLPRPDNAILRLARALERLDADQPVRLNGTTRRYLSEMAKTPDYEWLAPIIPMLENPDLAMEGAASIRARDPEMDALLRTTITPTMLSAGLKINVIPNSAEALLDIRRLPDETREEVFDRLRRVVNDSFVEVLRADDSDMPATEPTPTTGEVYRALETVLSQAAERSIVVPYMSRGATDGSYLRQRGMRVYGLPLFARDGPDTRVHGNDERISEAHLAAGTELLWKAVIAVAGEAGK